MVHLQLAFEDSHNSGQDIYATYIDFKGVYPSVDHEQLQYVLTSLGLPEDFIRVVKGLYAHASTRYLTPHGLTDSVPILRGTLQGDPLSPLLFDLMMEPLLRWLAKGSRGYLPSNTSMAYPTQAYADDLTLLTDSLEDMLTQFDKLERFSTWSHILINGKKCAITAYLHSLQRLRKADRDRALADLMAHVQLAGTPLPCLSQDDPLPGNYLGTAITASLHTHAQTALSQATLTTSCAALTRSPLPTSMKMKALYWLTKSKLRHTHSLATYSLRDVVAFDSTLCTAIKQFFRAPRPLATMAVQSPTDEVGLGCPSFLLDYADAAVKILLRLMADTGPIGAFARASLHSGAAHYRHWPLLNALDTNKSLMCRYVALAQMAGFALPPSSCPPLWGGNQISNELSAHLQHGQPALPNLANPLYPNIRTILHALLPLWRAGIFTWAEVLTASNPCSNSDPAGTHAPRSYAVLTLAQFKLANPLPKWDRSISRALKYLTALLVSSDLATLNAYYKSNISTRLTLPTTIAARWASSPFLTLTSVPNYAPKKQSSIKCFFPVIAKPNPEITPEDEVEFFNAEVERWQPTKRTGTRGKKRKAARYVYSETPLDNDTLGEASGILRITGRRITKPNPNRRNPKKAGILQYRVEWLPEQLPFHEVVTQRSAGFVSKSCVPLPLCEISDAPHTPCATCHIPDEVSPEGAFHQVGCDRCNKWYHLACLPATFPTPPPDSLDTPTLWTCPACRPPTRLSPLPCQLCTVQWNPAWQQVQHIRSMAFGAQAIRDFEEARLLTPKGTPIPRSLLPPANRPVPGTGPHRPSPVQYANRQRKLRKLADKATRTLPAPTPTLPPPRSAMPANLLISPIPINPHRDAPPTGTFQLYTLAPTPQQADTFVRLCGPDGRAVSPHDISAGRLLFLWQQYHIHRSPSSPDFLHALNGLLLRYHPKSKRTNPQGSKFNIKNHWATPVEVMSVLREECGVNTELYSSPLNCNTSPGGTYFTAFPEDELFGATFDCTKYRWSGACQANPEYEAKDMLDAMQRAILSATCSETPFACFMILPHWASHPHLHASILAHPAVQLVTHVQKPHFKFVPPGCDPMQPGAFATATSPKWGVDILLVSNNAGFAQFINPARATLQFKLATALRTISRSNGFHDLHITINLTTPPQDLTTSSPDPTCPTPPSPAGVVANPRHSIASFSQLPASPRFAAPSSSPPPGSASPPAHPPRLHWPLDPSIGHLSTHMPSRGRALHLVEMCAGIATGLESQLMAGFTIASYTWADINPDAWLATQFRIDDLHRRFPLQFPRSASVGWDTRLPYDICAITPEMLDHCFPDGIDFIVAGPPCQPYSSAGKRKGFGDPRSLALLATARIIYHLHHKQGGAISYVIENVPGTEKFAEVQHTLGMGTYLDAPACGSHAHRAAIFWQNLMPTSALAQAYSRLPSGPTSSINQLLATHAIEGWRTQELIQGRNWHPDDKLNIAGRDQKVLPKFVCFVGSHKFRQTGRRFGLGMMHYLDQPLQEPPPEIREVAMGFGLHSTAAPGLSPAQRHHLLGQCIDRNLLTWIFSAAADHTYPRSAGPAAQPTPPAHTPLPVRSWTEISCPALPYDGTNIINKEAILPTANLCLTLPSIVIPPPSPTSSPPSLLLAALPAFQARWDHNTFTYTDGSKKPSSPLLGAGVYHAPSGAKFVLNASGQDENHTITRAELIAIHFAIDTFAQAEDLHILTDSMCCILKIQAALTHPRLALYDPHAPLVTAITKALTTRASNAGLLTSIRKVPAHSGVEGNEIADDLANQGADSHSKNVPDVIVCSLGAVPQRPTFWPTYAPPSRSRQEGAAEPAPRHLASLTHIRKIATPLLTSYLANRSLYRSLMVHAMQVDGALLSLPAANIQALIAKGERKHAMQLFKFMWGQLYNGKLAHRYGHADNDNCPLCGHPDSCTHIGSGCKKHSGLYINRHNAAVRCISNFLSTGPTGADSLLAGMHLVSCDAGTQPLPDPTDLPALLDLQEAVLAQWAEVDLDDIACGTDTRGSDVSLDPATLKLALDRLHMSTDLPITAPRRLPEWLLPGDISDALREVAAGVTPDIVMVHGVSDVLLPDPTTYDRSKCRVVIIEVGFCADLRCAAKLQQKRDHYEPLVAELRKTWGEVILVLLPIGNAGTLLQSSIDSLAAAVAATPDHPPTHLIKPLASKLSAMASLRLLGIIKARNTAAFKAGEKERRGGGAGGTQTTTTTTTTRSQDADGETQRTRATQGSARAPLHPTPPRSNAGAPPTQPPVETPRGHASLKRAAQANPPSSGTSKRLRHNFQGSGV